MTPEALFERAVAIVARGEPLPLDLAMALLAFGFDVEAIERKHGL
jgi:hypothetical protein